MKVVSTIKNVSLAALLMASSYTAYSLPAVPYSDYGRGDNANMIVSGTISGVQLQIYNGTTVVYQEEFTNVATDAFGLFSVNIGSGTSSIGTYATLVMNKAYVLQLNIKPTAGSTYKAISRSPLSNYVYDASLVSAEALRAKGVEANLQTALTTGSASLSVEVARATAAEGVLTTNVATNATAIATETTNRTSADAALQTAVNTNTTNIATNTAAIATETTNRTSADAALQTAVNTNTTNIATNTAAIATETTNRTSADAALQTAVNTNTTNIATNTAAIATETTNRTSADAALQTAVNTNTTNIATNTAAIATETTNRTNADAAEVTARNLAIADGVSAAVTTAGAYTDAETTRATGVEATLATADATNLATAKAYTDTEKARAMGVEGTLATADVTNLATAKAYTDTETGRATAAEGVNASAITAENTRALAAEGANASAITAENTRALAAEGVNASAITAENTRALAAETALSATDVSNLASAKSYADGVGTATYNLAKSYADGADAANLTAAKNYADAGDATNLTTAKNYADAGILVEKTRAMNAEGVITASIAGFATQLEVDAVETGAGLNANGTFTADATTHYATTATSLLNADKLIDAQVFANTGAIAGEVSRATTAESNLVPKTTTVNGQALSANVSITPATLGLVIGTDVQAYNANTTVLGNTIDLATAEVAGVLPLANIDPLVATDADVAATYVPKTTTVNGQALSANVSITPATLGLVIGTDVQAYNANTTVLGNTIDLATAEVAGVLPLANIDPLVATDADVAATYVPKTTTVNGQALSANVSITPATLGLVIGTDVQAYNANTTVLGNTIDLATAEVAGVLPLANIDPLVATDADVAATYVPKTTTVNGQALSANVSITPATLGLVIGTDVQAYNANTTVLGNTIDLATAEVAGVLPLANIDPLVATDADVAATYVPKTTTVNGQALSANVSITPATLGLVIGTDVQAYNANTTVLGNTIDLATAEVAGVLPLANIDPLVATDADVAATYVPKTTTVNGQALSSNVSITPATLGLVIGTDVQAYNANTTVLGNTIDLATAEVAGVLPLANIDPLVATDADVAATYVPKTTTVNGQALSANVSITPATLGLVIGTDVQAYNANTTVLGNTIDLATAEVAGVLPLANIDPLVATDADVAATYVPKTTTVNGQALSANVSITPATLGLVIGTDVQAYNANTTVLGNTIDLATAEVAGVLPLANIDPLVATDADVAATYVPKTTTVNGQALSANVSITPATLGLVIGTDVQAYNANTTVLGNTIDLATAEVAGTLPLANGGTGVTSINDLKTALGLGTMASQGAGAVAITGGSISGVGITLGSSLTFDGTTAGAPALTFNLAADPSVAQTITIPNATGTMALLGSAIPLDAGANPTAYTTTSAGVGFSFTNSNSTVSNSVVNIQGDISGAANNTRGLVVETNNIVGEYATYLMQDGVGATALAISTNGGLAIEATGNIKITNSTGLPGVATRWLGTWTALPVAPAGPSVDEIYLNTSGTFYQWNGTAWTALTPNEGDMFYRTNSTQSMIYSAGAWVALN